MISDKTVDQVAFTEINLTEKKRKKCPKRLVYFSDGVLEEYSTDEDEMDMGTQETQPIIDPKTLPWVPYIGYMMWWLGARTLAICDYFGENLAWLLGITSPKFQYEIDQYKKMMKEQEELENYIAAENAGWSKDKPNENSPEAIEMQPVITGDSKVIGKVLPIPETSVIAVEPSPEQNCSPPKSDNKY